MEEEWKMRVRTKWMTVLLVALCLTVGLAVTQTGAQTAAKTDSPVLDRTVLPIADPKRPTYTELDVRQATPPPLVEVKAPAGAPNVLIVLIDDLGFGGTSTFGGPVPTPTFDRIARED
jgi:arylsulfatase